MNVYFDSGDDFRAILSSHQQSSEILDCVNKVLVHVETLVASPHTYLCLLSSTLFSTSQCHRYHQSDLVTSNYVQE